MKSSTIVALRRITGEKGLKAVMTIAMPHLDALNRKFSEAVTL